jgi:hypothetical protein
MFFGLNVGGSNEVWIRDDKAFVRVGTKVGKAPILKAEQREGFDPGLVVVLDSQANFYRTTDVASLPDGWGYVALDASNKYQFLTKATGLPQGWHLVHGMPGRPLPPILRNTP